MATGIKDELRALYGDSSKHSTYQSIPDFISAALGYSENIDEAWRGDRPRLRYLLSIREPAEEEHWGDFGANTGFFTLTLAHRYPRARFTAIEANPNHARFIGQIVDYFGLRNVEVLHRAIGLHDLTELPSFDFLLHLNVLHHAGTDFDADLVRTRDQFPGYAIRYLRGLRAKVPAMLFQMGSNWGGNKAEPLIGSRDDAGKLRLLSSWIDRSGWQIERIAYPRKAADGSIGYRPLDASATKGTSPRPPAAHDAPDRAPPQTELDVFPGEFYRRPLFLCSNESVARNQITR